MERYFKLIDEKIVNADGRCTRSSAHATRCTPKPDRRAAS